MLGDVEGPFYLQLVNELLQYNSLVDEIATRIATMNASQWPEAIEQLETHLTEWLPSANWKAS